jgi:hypothetical protein
MDTTTTMQLSLDGVRVGRNIGFKLARKQAAQIVLDEIKDTALALKVFKLIMGMVDGV